MRANERRQIKVTILDGSTMMNEIGKFDCIYEFRRANSQSSQANTHPMAQWGEFDDLESVSFHILATGQVE